MDGGGWRSMTIKERKRKQHRRGEDGVDFSLNKYLFFFIILNFNP